MLSPMLANSMAKLAWAVHCPESRGDRYSGTVNKLFVIDLQLIHSRSSAIRHTSAIGAVHKGRVYCIARILIQ